MKTKKVIATCVLGNALEFYDFTLYGVFAVIISQHFFPSSNEFISILASWGAFAAGFIMRPFGAAVFGYLGDKYGRKKALSLSILGMGIPTLMIGLLPSHQSIGILSPIVLVLLRLIQGLCTGGEYNGAAIFALEHVGENKPGFYGGMITGSCVIGAMLATGFGALVMHSSDPEFFWRLTFIFGGGVSFIGTFLRRKISESPEFLASQARQNNNDLDNTTTNTQGNNAKTANLGLMPKRSLIISFLIGCLNGALSYTLFGFLNNYLKTYIGVNIASAMTLNIVGLTCFMISCPIMGYTMDKIGKNTFFTTACLLVIGLSLSAFELIQGGSITSILCAQVLLGIATGAIAGPQHAFVQNLFPVQSRYRAISTSFCLGMAVCGGTAPMILTYLIEKTNNLYVPAVYIASISLLLFTTLSLSIRKRKEFFKQAA